MFLISSCSFLCPIHWNQLWNREWRCSWAAPVQLHLSDQQFYCLQRLRLILDYRKPPKKPHALEWRHTGRDSVSNHQPHDCLLNRLFRRRSGKTSKLRVTGLCAGNSPGTGEFPAQVASNAENVSIWWRHHGLIKLMLCHVSSATYIHSCLEWVWVTWSLHFGITWQEQ